jgi:hypothetical protein
MHSHQSPGNNWFWRTLLTGRNGSSDVTTNYVK